MRHSSSTQPVEIGGDLSFGNPPELQPIYNKPARASGRLVNLVGRIVLDLGMVYLSFLLAYAIRFQALSADREAAEYSPVSLDEYRIIGLFFTLTLIITLAFKGFYHFPRLQNFGRELMVACNSILISTAIVTFWMLVFQPTLLFSRLLFVVLVPTTMVLLAIELVALRIVQRQLWKRDIGVQKLLVVGATDLSARLMRSFAEKAHLGYKLVGFVDDELRYSDWTIPARYGNSFKRNNPEVPHLGNTSQLAEIIASHGVDEVVIALPFYHHNMISSVVKECQSLSVRYNLVPDIIEHPAKSLELREINGVPMLFTGRNQVIGFNYFIKRSIDVLGSAALLVVLAIPMLAIAIAIKLDSAGPVIFRQTRIGKNGNPFDFYKFRSMYIDAEQRLADLEKHNETNGATFKMKNDPRVTRVGRFIRRTSLDELPQLFNVFLGKMTLVGPRPGLHRELLRYQPWHHRRLEVTPGLTGMWQVSGRSSTSFDEMVKLDIYYIENWSLALDIKILVRTVRAVLKGDGAY